MRENPIRHRRSNLATAATLLAVTLFLLGAAVAALSAASNTFPGKHWNQVASPEKLGYSTAKLRAARAYTQGIKTAGVMIVVNGVILDQWGETTRKYNVHSIRKSFLSALYGIHVAEGHIDLAKTMKDLGVDDNAPSLTEKEKSATVLQLLQARSGVYHSALYETAGMAAARPQRLSHDPGTFWYYNNWDFNTLGMIFRNLTRTDIFQEFKNRIGTVVEMEDFEVTDGAYVSGADSVYAAYPFRMTARDMARFGLLYLRHGKWRNRQVIPSQWIADSIKPSSDARNSGGYGYLWWVAAAGKHLPGVELEDGVYSARGAGGHYILVIPRLDMVIVHRVDTDKPGTSVSAEEFGTLVKMILAAKE